MKNIIWKLIPAVLVLSGSVAIAAPYVPPMNKVSFNLSEDAWVATDTAKVIVTIDALLNQKQMQDAYSGIINKLKKLSNKGQWHITDFQRSETKANLEEVTVTAEIRLPVGDLTGLRNTAKKLSSQGETYTIQHFDYHPDLAAIQQTKAKLREKIYQDAREEIERLSSVYPESEFKLNNINFIMGPMPVSYMRTMSVKSMGDASAAAPSLSNRIKMTANVVLAERSFPRKGDR